MKPATPLTLAMRRLGVSQSSLARRLGVNQSSISRAAAGEVSVELAARILDAIDPGRKLLDERHILYARTQPRRYGRSPGLREVEHG